MARNKKIVKYKQTFSMNIGVIIFLIIFIYLCYLAYRYLTSTHMSVYEVQAGEISQNTTYTGLIIRDELLCNAEQSGYIDYYRKDSSKVGTQSVVCTIDTNGNVHESLKNAGENAGLLNSEHLKQIDSAISSYISEYSRINFYHVYNFKVGIHGQVQEDVSMAALDQISDEVEAARKGKSFYSEYPSVPGLISYFKDGYESVTLDNFTKDQFNESTYTKVDLRNQEQVTKGQPIYKLLTNENWNIVIPIENSLAKRLKKKEVLNIHFPKDDTSQWVNCSILKREDQKYLVLSSKASMVRFATDRFINVEFDLDHVDGLKIPTSSIVYRDYYKIPQEYVERGGASSTLGVTVQRKTQEGDKKIKFIELGEYFKKENSYYVACNKLKIADVILQKDQKEPYTIEESSQQPGVYNINKGYAVFRQIQIKAQKESYAIIDAKTSGISQYDHIALDGKLVTDGEQIH